MALATRCPHCGTGFRVSAQQLQQRDGLVRCGRCARVFTGTASLVEISGAPWDASPSAALADATPPDAARDLAQVSLTASDTEFRMPDASASSGPGKQVLMHETDRRPRQTAQQMSQQRPPPATPSSPRSKPAPTTAQPRNRRTGRLIGWSLAVLLLCGLALGGAWLGRDRLILHAPWSAPALRWLGAQAGDAVQTAPEAASLFLHTRDLERGEAPGQFILRGVLRNMGAQPLRWPSLEISLIDATGAVLLRRGLRAADYLAGHASFDEARGLPPGGVLELRVELTLDADSPEPVSHRIALFYP